MALFACGFEIGDNVALESQNRVTTVLRIDRDLHRRLVKEALDRDVSTNWLISRLLEEGIEQLVPTNRILLTRDKAATGGEG